MIFNRIRTRVVAYFIATAVCISLLFGLLGLLFSYYVEDAMFNQLLVDERERIEQQLERGETPVPTLAYVQYYPDIRLLPGEVLTVLDEEPNRVEFSGADGKHYHLKHLDQGVILAEVSDYLVVRKIKGGMAYIQLIILAVIVLIVALVAWFMAKRLIRPIDQLHAVLTDVEGQELPVGFSSQFGNDEIGMFAKELDSALSRVQAFIKREQDFTRDVSHELRTPVAISQGAVSLLKDTRLDREQQELADRLELAQEQMQQCIDGLLALAREEGFREENVRILPLLESAIVEHHQLLETRVDDETVKKDVELDLDVAPDVEFWCDVQAMRIILGNLIANAFAHTDSGTIRIVAGPDTLTISNTGTPIDPELLPDIFQSGIKGKQSSGYGIGLSLVQRLCERLGIDISIESDESRIAVVLNWAPGLMPR
ncbi:sensor histidine kinase [Biformimicrobium ophioploci]|uniref:histidine kinase n=1 Tax=Biformimicrobium ophioploci TaxID=3036711 RepID=A0ABQ6LZ13_9GAMM|nr:HAMP domain-containing sensor histidine kinase [Microbulbifer sp. NKW57]GMG87317.1 HAMP domain-containing sensor histidine kinase [Microbulbifer sp. NKW57]